MSVSPTRKNMFEDVKALLNVSNRQDLEIYAQKASLVEGDFLEVGSYLGGSALHIMRNMPVERSLYCCDPWGRNLKVIRENMIKYKQWDKVIPIANDYRILPQYLDYDQKFAFIFIDNDHTYTNTAIPVLMLWYYLSTGGYFLFHDYGHPDYPGVKAFIDELICYDFVEEISHKDGLFVVKKTRDLSAEFISSLHRYFHNPVNQENLLYYERARNYEFMRRYSENGLQILNQRLKEAKCDLPEENILLLFHEFFKGHSGTVALYGAGAHTCWLLNWLRLWGIANTVTVIIDENKVGYFQEIPIIKLQDFNDQAEAVLISSDTYHETLFQRANSETWSKNRATINLYSNLGKGPFPKWNVTKFKR